MSIHAALNHVTHYKYDRPVTLGPQVVRLRPAPHCRSNIISYSLKIEPVGHFVNWQQDPFANYQARLVFPEKATEFKVTVDLVAEMAVYNPFDFFLEPDAEEFPFTYAPELKQELAPYLITEPATPLVQAYLDKIDRTKRRSVIFLVDLNQMVHKDINYTIRMEPGVQTPEETLDAGLRLLPRLRLAAGAAAAPLRPGGALRLGLPDPAGARREEPGRPQWHRGRFHRPARLVRGLPAWRRLGGAGRHLRPAGR
jgi:transglutaminase-like putative cysteine protease